ncbi:hypothetical protein BC937DRAFT_89994 [Endogone sp. FLAS-F59071]|nr:hypothetical protein BC937DRAFT_89994 [Endogone sp. FLAS-F59071]|eukprot:RUS17422.1 hypothetical protein BC937DRAFT_89994 [Endogone sp. FLAS-F59071]
MANDLVHSDLQLLAETISQIYALPEIKECYILHFKRKAAAETLPEDAPEGVKGAARPSTYVTAADSTMSNQIIMIGNCSGAHSASSPRRRRICVRASCSRIHDVHTTKFQYVSSINTQKLMNYVRSLKNNEISRKNYNFRLTSAENSLALTGFDYGGVSPIGMKQPIPVVLSQAITELQPPVFYLGAGHVDWKISMPIEDFLKASACFVADLS